MQRQRAFGASVLLLVVLTVATRLPLLVHRYAVDDEVMYSVVANQLVDGGRPYVDAVERKPPLLFWTYEAITRAGGKYNWPALHLTALAWTLLTMAGLYCVSRDMFDRETGLAAAFLYCIFQPWGTPTNLAFNGELMMNLPLAWGWALVLGRQRLIWRVELLAAGVLLAAGFLLKQPAAIAAVPMGIYLLLPSYRTQRGYSTGQSVLHAALLSAGFFGTLGATAWTLSRQGLLEEALYWTVRAHDVPHVFWARAFEHTLAFVAACLPLCAGAAVALRMDRFGSHRRAERTALILLLVVSAVGTAAGGRFYPHYYIQLVAPLALIAAPAFTEHGPAPASRWLAPRFLRASAAILAVGFWLAAWVVLGAGPGPTESGEYVRAHSTPEDRIFVWGQAPGIYLDAERRPASRYITTFPLTGYIFGPPLPDIDTSARIVPGAWDHFVEDVTAHPPAYIVDVRAGQAARYPVEGFPILARLLAERYRPVKTTAEGVVYRLQPTDLPR